MSGRTEIDVKVSGWMERGFLSPAARGETRSEHGPGTPGGLTLLTDTNRVMVSFVCLSLGVFSPTERSAPVASLQHLCARACSASRERAFVTASRGGGRRTEDRSRGKRSSCRGEEEEGEEEEELQGL